MLRHDLHFVEVAGGKERADGPVDQARGQDFLGGGPAFALDEAAGELAGGVGFLAIIDDEREEIPTLDRLRPRRRPTSDTVSPYCDDDGTMRPVWPVSRFPE